MNKFGFVRVTVSSPNVSIADPHTNVARIIEEITKTVGTEVIVFPELSITGYTCGDLFRQKVLLDQAQAAIHYLASKTMHCEMLIFVGAPVRVGTAVYNCAIALHRGSILGIVPKQHIPNYNEFYESRWFTAPIGNEPKTIPFAIQASIPFGTDLIFQCGELRVFAEICEDLWMPIPPSSFAALEGANLIVNLSASPELVGKAEYRAELVRNQSARCLTAYAYSSAGPMESTSDLVFSGHCLIAENGSMLSETAYVGNGDLYFNERSTSADIDIQKMNSERQIQRTFAESRRLLDKPFRNISFGLSASAPPTKLLRKVTATPFVPSDPKMLDERCAAVFDLQVGGLVRRLKQVGVKKVTIGVSGGLDSTLALLVCDKAMKVLGLPPTAINAVTMPGFGTTEGTKSIANSLMKELGVDGETIDIRPMCMQSFFDMKHCPFGMDIRNSVVADEKLEWSLAPMPVKDFEVWLKKLTPEQRKKGDLVFENVQARTRTFFLMNKGFVIGTGDLSELALGWCTYNGDHMSMYNVNCGLPKTLIQWMVRYVADNGGYSDIVRDMLHKCAGLVISPELLPTDANGNIEQSTEDFVGPYILHDFFMLHLVRYGFTPAKILYLADQSDLATTFSPEVRFNTLTKFLTRFFGQQFKRDCVPDGPKVGSVSLSPRGDWRMPTEAQVAIWLADLENVKYLYVK